ncbi:resistance to inhibitors of cholinesterase protein 3-like [Uloborus diversus]|uniref:resistance to inhibitors of cholinesterase protein 3-like n=1 Tax=Uloborus diversus TaxID=327109 RepID=UPI002409F7B2|nr:resistance to inhibitors of cholinesterase protein 3-like [Uloborus diversus]
MAQADFGTGKSLVILAIVVGCFAILWPKIFYPMMQTAFAMTSPKMDSDSPFGETDRPPHLHPGSINPRLRNSLSDSVQDKFNMREGRPFPHPQARQPVKAQPKSGGAMSIIMPIYTVGIIVFFLYTVLKLVFKKPNEAEKKPLIKDFHMDPQYRKFVCENEVKKVSKEKEGKKSQKKQPKLCESTITEHYDAEVDEKDSEILKLKQKLAETEQAMERIMKHMNAMSECVSEKIPAENNCCKNEKSDVRQRHKKNATKKADEKRKVSKNYKDEANNSPVDHDGCRKLQEDLAKLIKMSAAKDASYKKSDIEYSMPKKIYELSEINTIKEMHSESEEEEQSEAEEQSSNEEEKEVVCEKEVDGYGCCNKTSCECYGESA